MVSSCNVMLESSNKEGVRYKLRLDKLDNREAERQSTDAIVDTASSTPT
jgi:hypothetical protein